MKNIFFKSFLPNFGRADSMPQWMERDIIILAEKN